MSQIILVHGMNATKESWGIVPEKLEPEAGAIVSVQLPGHEKEIFKVSDLNVLTIGSFVRNGSYNGPTDMNTYISSIASHFNPGTDRDIVLIGHSLGGAVISHVASKYSDRIAGLIYIAAMVPENKESAKDIMDTIYEELDIKGLFTNNSGSWLGAVFSIIGKLTAFIKDYNNADDDLSLVEQPEKPLSEPFNRTNGFEAIPWFYILCEKDDVIPASIQQMMIDRYSKIIAPTHVARMPTGHLPQYDDPDRLVEILKEMLSSKSANT